ncbi:MAG TPA: NlpC/P60 family protein [Panacibacter sp.]|nr:NlpC/P60 family protein [Panacibacter sp.]
MKKIIYLYLLGAVVLLNGCKSIHKLTARDNSTSSRQKQQPNSNEVTFLNNVSVTPGKGRTAIDEPALKPAVTKDYTPTVIRNGKNFNIESASQLQFKYAMILDVPVEEINNIPLLQDIDYWWGTKYCMGGSTENCTDCSAFTHNVLLDVYALNIPRTAKQQYDSCMHISIDALQQGDLVFFQTSSRKEISHVGVYIANNKFAHASVSNGVMISDLNDPYWKPKFRGAGRVKK